MIDAIRYIYRFSKFEIITSAIVSLMSGAFNALLLSQISAGVTHHLSSRFFTLFVILVVATFTTTLAAQLISLRLTARFSMRMRIRLCRTIIDTPLRKLEDIGSHRLLAALTQDTSSVAQAAIQIPQLCMNVAVILCCFVYLGYISLPLFLGMFLLLPFAIASCRIPEKRAVGFSVLERESWDELVGCFETVTNGLKELKLSRARRTDVLSNQLTPALDAAVRYGTLGASMYVAIGSWGNLLCFVVIGLLFGVVPRFTEISTSALISCAFIALYLRAPILSILQSLEGINRASIALKKLHCLGLPWELPSSLPDSVPRPAERFERIELVDVIHEYFAGSDDRLFSLGPVSLTLDPGRLVFITGGNGCGKTTLAKILTGLYVPSGGTITLNGNVVDSGDLDDYRQYFSAVFADFALFERVIDADSPACRAEINRYLRLLQLSDKVFERNGRLSTVQLSAGQRRRLALLHAYLEDRPVYLFDEWAADQDREFREIFYRVLLPQMRDRGKAVVVISHDERYYEVADEIIRLERGRVVSSERYSTIQSGHNMR
jgi:putative pyoverdin transport system ATP-binding/permease protein